MGQDAAAPEDELLIRAVAERRDPDALARLYDLYGGLAYGVMLRMLGDRGLAEEATQEAFFNVWRNAARYTAGKGSVRTWLMSIVHHQGIDRLRRQRARQRLEDATQVTEDSAQGGDVWTEVSANLERQGIAAALRALPA